MNTASIKAFITTSACTLLLSAYAFPGDVHAENRAAGSETGTEASTPRPGPAAAGPAEDGAAEDGTATDSAATDGTAVDNSATDSAATHSAAVDRAATGGVEAENPESPAPATGSKITPEQIEALAAMTQRSPSLQPVKRLHATILEAMKQAATLGYEGRRRLLAPVLHEVFDFAFMGSKAAGKHWHGFDQEQRRQWLEAFEGLTVANYAGRFKGYSGESFQEFGEEPASHDTVIVRSVLHVPGSDDVQLDYRVRMVAKVARIIDVYMQGTVSELALRRAEYSSALEREGFDKVLATLKDKAERLKDDSDG